MKRFNNILYVTRGITDLDNALSQALFSVVNNKANLNILILYPVLPGSFDEYKDSYEESLLSNVRKSLKTEIEKNGYCEEEIQQMVTFAIETCDTPIERITQHVLRDEYDLVMKQSEGHESGKGFKALDMGLMRKCPCPVWLYHSTKQTEKIRHIVVAIDPESPEISGADLAEHLLRRASDLSCQMDAKLTVISCWNYAYEETIRGSDFAAIPEDTLSKIITDAQEVHFATLQTILKGSAIGDKFELKHIKGVPTKVIPDFVNNTDVDLLIMGTVARTGIPGFLMGNTAEDILQKIECSLLALKPAGFITPIKAF